MTRKTSAAVTAVTVQAKPPAREREVAVSGESLISQAIDQKVPVETMEKLLAMRRELRAEAAKEQFEMAMARFQANCPVIGKSKKVLNKDGRTVRYSYAPLDVIVCEVGKQIAAEGLSFSFETVQDSASVTATCVVNHHAGHSKPTSFAVPIDPEGYMNKPQKFASALTFAKRYAFCNAFGIMTGDEDDDARQSDEEARPAAAPAPGREATQKVRTEPAAAPQAPFEDANQHKRLLSLFDAYGMTREQFENQIGKPVVRLSEREASAVADRLEKKIAAGERHVPQETMPIEAKATASGQMPERKATKPAPTSATDTIMSYRKQLDSALTASEVDDVVGSANIDPAISGMLARTIDGLADARKSELAKMTQTV